MFAGTRTRSLYSDFRELKLVNIEGFEANVREWRHHLLKNLWKDKLLVNSDSLLQELSTKEYGFPKSIDIVIDQLVKEGILVPIFRYIQNENNGLIMSLLKWSIHKTIFDLSWKSRCSESENYLKSCKYVNLSWFSTHNTLLFDSLRCNIYEKADKYVDYVYTKRDFYKISGIKNLIQDWESYEVVLEYLCRERELIMNNEGVLKLVGTLSTLSTDQCKALTTEDIHTAAINEVFHKIESKASLGEDLIVLTKRKLRESISRSAPLGVQKTLLRLQKQSERDLEQTYQNLEKIKKIRDSISAATDNVTMFSLLKQSNSALKAINSNLIDKESIEKVLDEFDDLAEHQSEISALLTHDDNIGNEQLEEELKILEKEESAEKESSDEKSTEKCSLHGNVVHDKVPLKQNIRDNTDTTKILESLSSLTVEDKNKKMTDEIANKSNRSKSNREPLLA